MEHIHLPNTIEFKEGDEPNVGQVIITPCQQGYGTTLGNSLRRVLLSSLPGAAVESVKIEGVSHEFSAVEDVQEDMVEIILNLKQMAVKLHSDEPITLSLTKKGKGEITPADFEKNADVEIMNPDLKLMTSNSDREINMEIIIGKGSGYVSVAEKDTKDLPLGTIAIDSLYTPIRDVGYKVELTRVGDITDFEELTVNIETNGTISPKDAVAQSTKVLMDHFALILDASAGENEVVKKKKIVEEPVVEENEVEEMEVTEDVIAEEDNKDESVDEEEVKKKSKKKASKKKE